MPDTRVNTPVVPQPEIPKEVLPGSHLQQHIQSRPQRLSKRTPTGAPTKALHKTRKNTRKPTPIANTTHSILAHNMDKPAIGIDDFMDMLCALHFSSYVPSPILDAGGLMLVAPSGSLKSSLLTAIANLYPSRCICDSNWYYGKLMKLCGSFYNRSIRSIIIPELASLYVGDPRTGGRMEQMFQQMAGEGSQTTNENDSRFSRYEMRATIFGALTPEFATKKHKGWEEGFHRRFLWAYLSMEDDDILLDYLIQWKRCNIEMNLPIMEPSEGLIPDLLTTSEKRKVANMLIDQKVFGPNHTRFIVYAKAVSVLRWHYKRMKIKKDAMQTAKNFSGCLSEQAAILIIPKVKK